MHGPFLRRFAAVATLLSVIPATSALVAALLHTNSHGSLARLAFENDAAFAVSRFALAAAASLSWSAVLAAASWWAFRDRGLSGFARIVRVVVALWVSVLVLYPGFGSWIPIVRSLPWIADVALALGALVILHLIPELRLAWREAIVTAGFVSLFLVSPSFLSTPRISAHRPLGERDVLILGWDSLSHDDTAAVIREFVPSRGTKTTFTNAWTPIAMTSIAWRTVLSGQYPGPENTLPGVDWPSPSSAWLPRELAGAGYRPVMYQDNPATNTYRPNEYLTVPALQGWKSILNEFAWKLMFPASTAGAPWWVAVFGGPARRARAVRVRSRTHLERDLRSNCGEREGWARVLGESPLLLACARPSHSVRGLSGARVLASAATAVSREAATRSAQGRANGGPAIREARLVSVRRQILWVLRQLDNAGVLGSSTLLLLSDHGERAENAPLARVNHVMLASFAPGPRRDIVVSTPVSLADVAPTIRRTLGIPQRHSFGVPLPAEERDGDPRRSLPRVSAPTTPRSAAVSGVDPAQMRRALRLNTDGTFRVDAAEFRAVAEVGPDAPAETFGRK